MPADRQLQFILRNTLAVITDPYQLATGFSDNYLDLARAGIDRVFDQFFNHRNRSVNYFAGSDLRSYGIREFFD